MSDPLMLAEVLTRATDAGGFTAHLALQSLFLLVTQHGLEYPRFYERLYGLLTPALFQVRVNRNWRQALGVQLSLASISIQCSTSHCSP